VFFNTLLESDAGLVRPEAHAGEVSTDPASSTSSRAAPRRKPSTTVTIVERLPEIRARLATRLREAGYDMVHPESLEEALAPPKKSSSPPPTLSISSVDLRCSRDSRLARSARTGTRFRTM